MYVSILWVDTCSRRHLGSSHSCEHTGGLNCTQASQVDTYQRADNIAVCLDYQVASGIQYAGEGTEKSTSTYANKTEMAQDILNAEPVARTDYGEDEAPF